LTLIVTMMRFRRAEAQGQPAGAEPDCPRLEALGGLAPCPGVPRMPRELKPNGRRFLAWLEAWPTVTSLAAWFSPSRSAVLIAVIDPDRSGGSDTPRVT
jgi:hypothetical protein